MWFMPDSFLFHCSIVLLKTKHCTLITYLFHSQTKIVYWKMQKFCEVCGASAHGYHFGAISCRACAAFFKRALLAKQQRKSCKYGEGCTDFSGISSPSCKSCRLEKCLKVGMNDSNLQSNRKPIQAVELYAGPRNLRTSGSPTKQRTYIDVKHLIYQGLKILNMGSPCTLNQELTQLQKLSLCSLKPPENPKQLHFIGKNTTVGMWELDFLSAAKWLTHFDELKKLPPGIQMQFLQTIWHLWALINKLIRTAGQWENGWQDSKRLQLCDDSYIDMDNAKVDVSWATHFSFDVIRYFLHGQDSDLRIGQTINKISKLQFSEVELTFMVSQLCFQYAASRFTETEFSEVCEKFQEILANDLHQHYASNSMSDKNYAGRLSQILKINQEILKDIRSLREKTLIANTFDLFKVDFSHPEMFVDTGYK
ncbi:hypothetical protein CRE_19033 [Caenorhabditis remanei]|uniref:Nuclear Hormone Receptor family n=1 Tax=Caenorhabditis remanei TaxID=31234 RepID=E3LLA1_CAERE|nr:hypothetical protein CRE_19033 [Caenorhabditis remanei]